MARVSIPAWHLVVGAETVPVVQDLFAGVIMDLQMTQTERAEKLEVDPATMWRWARGGSTPLPAKMLEAVELVRSDLEQLLDRASTTRTALRHLVAAEKAEAEGGFGAGREEVAALKKLLEVKDG